jgi:hypothetical protein
MALGLLSLCKKWVPGDISEGKVRPARADNLTDIYDPTV